MSKIFIIVPAYEDPYLYRTLDEATSKASSPENLVFAIALQYKNTPLPDLSRFSGDNFKYINYDVDTRPGVNHIRHNLTKLYSGEEYYLMIDSHMHFDDNWDQRLIDAYRGLQESHGEKVIWSQPLPSELDQGMSNITETKWGFKHGVTFPGPNGIDGAWDFLLLSYGLHEVIKNPEKYMESVYASAHFLFTTGNFIEEVGINGIADTYEEEPFLYFSSYLSGWRFYKISDNNFISHDNDDYNKNLYGDTLTPENYMYTKRFSSSKDSIAQVIAMDLAILFNDGPAKIKNAVMDPIDFYEKFGLRKQYIALRDLYLTKYDEFLKIAQNAIDK